MHISTLKLTPPHSDKRMLMGILRVIQSLNRVSPGCLESSVFAESEPGQKVFILERWQSQADLHRHLQSDLYRRILELMELSVEAPDIHFYQVMEEVWLDAVAEARKRMDSTAGPAQDGGTSRNRSGGER